MYKAIKLQRISSVAVLPAAQISKLVVVDSNVEDYESLAAGVGPNAWVAVLNPTKDGIAQVTALLEALPVRELHLISHGTPGRLQLGNSELSLATLARYRPQLETWFKSCVGAVPAILLYGCSVAAGETGKAFLRQLRHLTGAGIAASTSPIGSGDRGGNWTLDVVLGQCIPALAIAPEVRAAYSGVLDAAAATPVTAQADEDDLSPDQGAPAGAIINEWSQGSGGGKEWVELLITEDGTNLQNAVLADTNRGMARLQLSGSGFAALPAGTFVVIYNGSDPDEGLVPDLTLDLATGDRRLLIPSTNATGDFAITPASATTGGNAWGSGASGAFGNTNAGDVPVLMRPGSGFFTADDTPVTYSAGDALATFYGILPFNAASQLTPDGPPVRGIGANGTFLYLGRDSSGITTDGNWSRDTNNEAARGNSRTPGEPNAQVIIAQSDGGTAASEDGATDSYTIVLRSQPTDTVTVTATPDAQTDLGTGAGQPVTFTFTPANWFTPQTVTVAAVDDDVIEGDHSSRITHWAASANPDSLYNSNAGSDAGEAGLPIVVDGRVTFDGEVPVAIADNEVATSGDGTPSPQGLDDGDGTTSLQDLDDGDGTTSLQDLDDGDGTTSLQDLDDNDGTPSPQDLDDNGGTPSPQDLDDGIIDAVQQENDPEGDANSNEALDSLPGADSDGILDVVEAGQNVPDNHGDSRSDGDATADFQTLDSENGTDDLVADGAAPDASGLEAPDAADARGLDSASPVAVDDAYDAIDAHGGDLDPVEAESASPDPVEASSDDQVDTPAEAEREDAPDMGPPRDLANTPTSPVEPSLFVLPAPVELPGPSSDGDRSDTQDPLDTQDLVPAVPIPDTQEDQSNPDRDTDGVLDRLGLDSDPDGSAMEAGGAVPNRGAMTGGDVPPVDADRLPADDPPSPGAQDGNTMVNILDENPGSGASGLTVFSDGAADPLGRILEQRRGRGRNLLIGGGGSDILNGFSDADTLNGGGGNDIINGGSSIDQIVGGADNDILNGGTSGDRMFGGAGRDLMNGGSGSDWMSGGAGPDQLNGGRGKDRIRGGDGNDTLTGGSDDDRLWGTRGRDQLRGGRGRDVLIGGLGRDTLTGGQGRDRFRYRRLQEFGDVIIDFEILKDRIDLRRVRGVRSRNDVALAQRGEDAVVRVSAGGSLRTLAVLEAVDANTLGAHHFII